MLSFLRFIFINAFPIIKAFCCMTLWPPDYYLVVPLVLCILLFMFSVTTLLQLLFTLLSVIHYKRAVFMFYNFEHIFNSFLV